MRTWEVLILAIRFGDNEEVASVRGNGKKIFSHEKLSVFLLYLDDLKNKGWKETNVTLTEWGEIREFKRIKD